MLLVYSALTEDTDVAAEFLHQVMQPFALCHLLLQLHFRVVHLLLKRSISQHPSAYVSVRRHQSAYVSIRQHQHHSRVINLLLKRLSLTVH